MRRSRIVEGDRQDHRQHSADAPEQPPMRVEKRHALGGGRGQRQREIGHSQGDISQRPGLIGVVMRQRPEIEPQHHGQDDAALNHAQADFAQTEQARAWRPGRPPHRIDVAGFGFEHQ